MFKGMATRLESTRAELKTITDKLNNLNDDLDKKLREKMVCYTVCAVSNYTRAIIVRNS